MTIITLFSLRPVAMLGRNSFPFTLDDVYEPSTMDKLRSAYHYGTDIVCVFVNFIEK